MKLHEITVPDLPEGWKPITYRWPKLGEWFLVDDTEVLATRDYENSYLIIEKI